MALWKCRPGPVSRENDPVNLNLCTEGTVNLTCKPNPAALNLRTWPCGPDPEVLACDMRNVPCETVDLACIPVDMAL